MRAIPSLQKLLEPAHFKAPQRRAPLRAILLNHQSHVTRAHRLGSAIQIHAVHNVLVGVRAAEAADIGAVALAARLDKDAREGGE